MVTTQLIRNSFITAGLIGAISFAVFAQDSDHPKKEASAITEVAVQVSGTVDETLSRINKMLADNGMMVMGEIHQGKILAMTGLSVVSESIFVGSPTVGKKLFSAELGAGLAVPIRINIYENADGKTVVHYIAPSQQLGVFNNAKVSKVAEMLDGKLHNMVSMLPK